MSHASFKIEWISKASAEQRSGRAGRTAPGVCYRLFSPGVFGKLDDFTKPQILVSPIDQVVLFLKSKGISDVTKFKFITPPEVSAMREALIHLKKLKAITASDSSIEYDEELRDNTKISKLGRILIKFPLSPKYSKALIFARTVGLQEHTSLLVSLLSNEQIIDHLDMTGRTELSDFGVLINFTIKASKDPSFVDLMRINRKVLSEVIEQHRQVSLIYSQLYGLPLSAATEMDEIKGNEEKLLVQVMLSCLFDSIARKVTKYVVAEGVQKRLTYYENSQDKVESCLSHTSVLRRRVPDFVVYKEVVSNEEDGK